MPTILMIMNIIINTFKNKELLPGCLSFKFKDKLTNITYYIKIDKNIHYFYISSNKKV